MTDITALLADTADDVAKALDAILPHPETDGERLAEARLLDAMRYATEGGKRLRAFLALESAAIFGVDRACAINAACAVECIHAYSLIHDDLPCMDDDDLRRGRPTVHKAFDEATAVLAGDALQAYAFEILTDPDTHKNPFVRAELVSGLAKASGPGGMVGGQMIDIEAENADGTLSMPEITRLQHMKTGALIEFACQVGPIMGQADSAHVRMLEGYGRVFGLVFQIVDDLLDAEGDEAAAGKTLRKDAGAGKATFVETLGIETARERAAMLTDQALTHIKPLGPRGEKLAALARFALERKH